MSFIYDFSDNLAISAADINAIASEIGENTSVSDNFDDNVSYAINKLNCIRSDILNPGIAYGMECSCTDEVISINSGVAFFKNGMRIEITEPETFPVADGDISYVYLYASESYSCAMPIVTASKKESDSYIPVAEVDKYGNVNDIRQFSTSKIPLCSGSAVQKENISYATVANSGSLISKNQKTYTINLKDKYFSYVIFEAEVNGKTESGVSHTILLNGYFKRSSGLCYGIYDNKPCFAAEYIGNRKSINYGTYIKPIFEDGILKIQTDCVDNVGTFSVSAEVI